MTRQAISPRFAINIFLITSYYPDCSRFLRMPVGRPLLNETLKSLLRFGRATRLACSAPWPQRARRRWPNRPQCQLFRTAYRRRAAVQDTLDDRRQRVVEAAGWTNFMNKADLLCAARIETFRRHGITAQVQRPWPRSAAGRSATHARPISLRPRRRRHLRWRSQRHMTPRTQYRHRYKHHAPVRPSAPESIQVPHRSVSNCETARSLQRTSPPTRSEISDRPGLKVSPISRRTSARKSIVFDNSANAMQRIR